MVILTPSLLRAWTLGRTMSSILFCKGILVRHKLVLSVSAECPVVEIKIFGFSFYRKIDGAWRSWISKCMYLFTDKCNTPNLVTKTLVFSEEKKKLKMFKFSLYDARWQTIMDWKQNTKYPLPKKIKFEKQILTVINQVLDCTFKIHSYYTLHFLFMPMECRVFLNSLCFSWHIFFRYLIILVRYFQLHMPCSVILFIRNKNCDFFLSRYMYISYTSYTILYLNALKHW